jgi:predicted flavoprotein YhiN
MAGKRNKVVVVGAGPAGIFACLEILKKKPKTRLVEGTSPRILQT